MGLIGGSSSSSTSLDQRQDRSLNLTDSENASAYSSNIKAGNASVGHGDNNEVSFDYSTNIIDGGAFDVIEGALDVVGDFSAEAFAFAQENNSGAFDFASSSAGAAFAVVEGVIDESLDKNENVINSAFSMVGSAVNNVLGFALSAQKNSADVINDTTAVQSEAFSESLSAMNRNVSTTISQGNTDVIKFVMMGLVGFGLVFAMIRGQ